MCSYVETVQNETDKPDYQNHNDYWNKMQYGLGILGYKLL